MSFHGMSTTRFLTRVKRQAPFTLNMQVLTMRRLFGVLLMIVAGIYWYTRLAEVDISELHLPEQIEMPLFWIGYGIFTTWMMLPQLVRTPGAAEVNLLPNAPIPFANQMMANSDPFQMNGQWYVQWDGMLWVWDGSLNQWSQATQPGATPNMGQLGAPPQY